MKKISNSQVASITHPFSAQYFAEYPEGYVDNFISENKIDTVTFCSPSPAKSFLRQFNGDKSLLDIVSIGTTTAHFLDKQGIVSRYPENFTVESMVEII